MKKITKDSVQAFESNRPFKRANMEVVRTPEGSKLLLHGNCIAEKIGQKLFVSSCDWETVTTKERLNGLQGVDIVQKNFVWYLNGKAWHGHKVEVAKW